MSNICEMDAKKGFIYNIYDMSFTNTAVHFDLK